MAEATKATLMQTANAALIPLQDAADLGMATGAETLALTAPEEIPRLTQSCGCQCRGGDHLAGGSRRCGVKQPPALLDSLPALNCSIVAAHPWVYGLGQQTDNGAYLSPANAVVWLGDKLASVTGETDVVILMATGQTHDDFMATLDPLTAVFPAPAFTQVSHWRVRRQSWPQ